MTTTDTSTDPAAPNGPTADSPDDAAILGPRALAGALITVAAVALAARFAQPSPIWGREAVDVALANLPLDRLPDALRHAGGPPLWIVVLHGWEAVAGTGDAALRALSGMFSVATIPVAWMLGRRLGGPRGGKSVGTYLALLAALSPCLLRYGSDAGPASMVILLTALGAVFLLDVVATPTPLRFIALALCTAGLLWTDYWTATVVAGAALAVGAVRRASRSGGPAPDRLHRRAATAALAAIAAGAATFALWLPVLWFQLSKAGTPWGDRVRPATVVTTAVMELNGGPTLLVFVTVPLLVIGIFGRRGNERSVNLDFHGNPDARGPAATLGVGFVLAAALSLATGTTFVSADSVAYLVPYLSLVALGVARFTGRSRWVAIAAVSAISIVTLSAAFGDARSQVRPALDAIAQTTDGPGLIVACPDQVGPSLYRSAPRRFRVLRYPDLRPADAIDWVGYDARMANADPTSVASEVRTAAAGRPVFVVIGRGYRGGGGCSGLIAALGAQSAGRIILEADVDEYRESMRVYEFRAL